jgi:DNA-binding Xre family transcriptional regulator
MLVFKINEVLLASGIKNPVKFLNRAGFSKNKAQGLVANSQKTITLLDLSRLCQMLQCTPNDLLYWQATQRLGVPDTHPLISQLTKAPAHANWLDLVGQVPKDQVLQLHSEVTKMIEELKEGLA